MISCTSSMVAMSLLLFVIDQGWSPSHLHWLLPSPYPTTLYPYSHQKPLHTFGSDTYHLCPNTTSTMPSTNLTSSLSPSLTPSYLTSKFWSNSSSPSSSPGGGAVSNSASAPSSSPYRSCGLLVPVPLLWATCPRTAPEGYSAARGNTALQCWD